VFLVAGSFFLVAMLKLAGNTIRERRWPTTPATILSTSFATNGGEEHPYRFVVRYRYQVGGGEHVGTTYRHGYEGSEDFRPVQRLLLRYPPGAAVSCRVNPEDPADAVLEARSPWLVLLVLFPLPFIALGLAVLVSTLRTWIGRKEIEPLAPTVSSRKPRRAPAVLGAILIAAGFGATVALLPWALGPIRARGWRPVRATVLSSTVRRHESTDSDGRTSVTYKLDILYRYQFGGRTYHSNRYGFVGGSSSGYYGKRDIARRYRPGSRVTAWVDPSDPSRAVLDRSYSALHLVALLPLILLAAGVAVFRKWSKAGETPASRAPGLPAIEEAAGPYRRLEPGRGRLTRVGALLFFCLFWNGIVSVFLVDVVQGFRHGHPPWFEAVFLVPFVFVGLFTMGLVVHSVLALANPRATVTLLTPQARLGSPFRITWRVEGRVERVRRLTIALEGREKATYRRGTDTHTDTRTFRTLSLAELRIPSQMRAGEAEVTIPEDTMHTFRGQSNQILWHLTVRGDVPHWPDVDDEWEVEVLPLPVGEV